MLVITTELQFVGCWETASYVSLKTMFPKCVTELVMQQRWFSLTFIKGLNEYYSDN